MNLQITSTLEEAHVCDSGPFLLGAGLARGRYTIIEIGHCVAVTIVTCPVEHVFQILLDSLATFLLANLTCIIDLLLECTHDTAKHVKHGKRMGWIFSG